jgi:hypothetical protein
MMTAYSISDISRTYFAAWRRCRLIASNCVARGHYFRIKCEKTSKIEDQFGSDRSVGKEEGIFIFTARNAFARISVSLDVNVV